MTKQHPIFMASTRREFFLDSLAHQSMDIKCHLSSPAWCILISEKEGKLTQVCLRKFSSHNHFLHSEFSFIARSAIWYHNSFKAPDEIYLQKTEVIFTADGNLCKKDQTVDYNSCFSLLTVGLQHNEKIAELINLVTKRVKVH